jgi:nitrogen fixation NifU-like protein
MDKNLQDRIAEALKNPQNLGELPGADAVGTVGNSDCGEMLRMWVKFKEQNGRKVIDRATFQSFGCETAIAVASLATELIRGKTAEEALALKTEELAGELGPLPPMKIHCAPPLSPDRTPFPPRQNKPPPAPTCWIALRSKSRMEPKSPSWTRLWAARRSIGRIIPDVCRQSCRGDVSRAHPCKLSQRFQNWNSFQPSQAS